MFNTINPYFCKLGPLRALCAISLFSFLALAPQTMASNGEDPEIPLLAEGKAEDAVLAPLSVIKMSTTLRNLVDDLNNNEDLKNGIPLNNIKYETLKAIINSLKAMQKLDEKQKSSFKVVSALIKDSMPCSCPPNILKLLKAINHLEINTLAKAAAGLLVQTIDAQKTKDRSWEKIALALQEDSETQNNPMARRVKQFQRYVSDNANEDIANQVIASVLGQDLTSITVGKSPSALTIVDNTLYVANKADGTISVINLNNNNIISSIKVGNEPSALMAFGQKLYVANRADNNLTVINLNTKHVEKTIAVGKRPTALAVWKDKLFVANAGDNLISQVNLTTDEVAEQTIQLKNMPLALTVFEDKIYAVIKAEYGDSIAVIDLTSNEVISQIGTPGEERLTPLIAAGKVLYVGAYASEYYNDFLASITPETKVLNYEKSILTGSSANLGAMHFADNKIFIAVGASYIDKKSKIIVIDLITRKPSATIMVNAKPIALTTFGDKLYIALEDTDTVLVYDFYYGDPK